MSVEKKTAWHECRYCGEPVLIGTYCVCACKSETREPPSTNGKALTKKDLDEFIESGALNKTLCHW